MTAAVKLKFETLYDAYSPMLNGIALQIAPTQKQARRILIKTFIRAYQQNIHEKKHPSQCIALIKLLIQTAHEQLNNNSGKTNFKLRVFESSPTLQHLLCEQATIDGHCEEYKITKEEAIKKIRTEFILLRKMQQENQFLFTKM